MTESVQVQEKRITKVKLEKTLWNLPVSCVKVLCWGNADQVGTVQVATDAIHIARPTLLDKTKL